MLVFRRKKKTHCKRGHEFTEDNTTYQIKNGEKHRSCKRCKQQYQRDYIEKNRDRFNLWQRDYRKRISGTQKLNYKIKQNERFLKKKLQVFSHYSPNIVCQCCGESEFSFLTIDHIYNNGNLHKKANKNLGSGISMYYWIAKHDFPKGFQVLCMNCNFGKRMNKGTYPHKTKKTND